MRLIAPTPTVCLGEQAIALEALMTNKDESPLEITPDGIGYGVELAKKDKDGRPESCYKVRDIEPDNWQTLNPNQTVILPFKEPITDSFFDGPGIYKITVRYGAYIRQGGSFRFTGAINSNSVIFEIAPCGKTH